MIPAAPSSPSAAPAPDGDAPSSAEAARRANRRGIRFMVAAMACFIANDAMVKLASASLPAAQLIFVRGMMATLLVVTILVTLAVFSRVVNMRRLFGGA
jgi:hypothetical protein